MPKTYWFCLSLLIQSVLISRACLAQDTLWNQTDSEGRKQGYWKKYYPDTTLMYVGYFCDDIPVGLFKRYYEKGKIRAVMNHNRDGIHTSAELYYQNGTLAAKGNYYRQAKDSMWNYYSYYTGDLMCSENYARGIKEGSSFIYYPSGQVAEIQLWKDNLREGKWIQFYEDSTLRQESEYLNGNLHGRYILYHINGTRIIEGEYSAGNMDGLWYFYNEHGQLEYQLRYRNGINLDEELYRQKALDYMKGIEENIGKIPEPDINDFVRQQ